MRENPHIMSLTQHLGQLRKCLIHSIVALIIGTAATLYFSKDLFKVLTRPLEQVLPQGSHFIATTPFESYMVYLKTAGLAGFLLSAPYIFLQCWRFFSPGLYKNEKKIILPIALFSGVFFVAGALFGYFVVFPTGFKFVVDILADTSILFMPSMNDYFSFSTKFLLAFGITFELPIFILLLARLGIIEYRHIGRFRKYAIIVIFIVAGILTPGPDVVSQVLMALPLILLYELGGLFAYLFGKKKTQRE
ncbi:MAG: twin-arginine translocase subunit TatC [Deltaproteobacteria bacterium]|nr:twin-arginine translocase subunit TatC [Deltaproteobacteria bacterium]